MAYANTLSDSFDHALISLANIIPIASVLDTAYYLPIFR